MSSVGGSGGRVHSQRHTRRDACCRMCCIVVKGHFEDWARGGEGKWGVI